MCIYIYIEACLYLYSLDNQCLSFPEALLPLGFFWKKVGGFPCSWQSSIGIPMFNEVGESCTFVTKVSISPTQGHLCFIQLTVFHMKSVAFGYHP